jgi:hypothetical protein
MWLISQTSADMPPKNGGVRKANWTHFFPVSATELNPVVPVFVYYH